MLEIVTNLVWWLLNLLGLILLVVSYTYISKLERIECACADHPYRKFIKGYIIFAIIFLLALMVVPISKVVKMFGIVGSLAYLIATLLFTVASIVFFVYAIIYVRYLVQVKCRCSEDNRRTALYVWAIAEIVILGVLVVIPLLAVLAITTIGLFTSGVKTISSLTPSVIEAVSNPIKSARRVPSTLRKELRAISRA